MEFLERVVYKPTYSKEEFIRKILLKFARIEEVSPDLIKAEFDEVRVFNREFFFVSGKARCDFTCSIGYNRTETYVEMETKSERIGNTWQKVSRPVNKTRTVTDWQAYSGSREKECSIIVNEKGERDNEAQLCEDILASVEHEVADVQDEVAQLVIEGAKTAMKFSAYASASLSLPGDTSKDFRGNETAEIEKIFSLIFPYYQVSYTYKGTKKTLSFCACADFNVEISEEEKKTLDYVPVDTKKSAKEQTKAWSMGTKISWLSVLAMGVLSGFIPLVGGLLCAASLALAIIVTVMGTKRYGVIKNELDRIEKEKKDVVVLARRKEVYAVLKGVLETNGLQAIDFEELYQ